MKRVGVAAFVVVVGFVLAGCIPLPSPPSGYLRPIIDSVSVPEPVAPGTDVTFTIVAHDDAIISGLAIRTLKVGDGRTFPHAPPCYSALADQGGDVTRATITVTCQVPTFANNGTWDLTVTVRDQENTANAFPGTVLHLKFTVVGGTDDTKPPHLESYSFDIPQLYTTSTFAFTALFTDPAGVELRSNSVTFSKKFGPSWALMFCADPQRTDVSASQVSFTWSCAAQPGRTEAGAYQFNIDIIDGLGHQGTSHVEGISVVSPPKGS